MKARINRPVCSPTILCTGYSGEKENTLRSIAKSHNIKLRAIADSELCESVNSLFKDSAVTHSDAVPIHSGIECLVFGGIEKRQLFSLIDELKLAGVSTPYKAVLSASNGEWTLDRLIGELIREHESIENAKKRTAISENL